MKTKADVMTELVCTTVQEMHESMGISWQPGKRNKWKKEVGQWIVYGLEEALTFANTVILCAIVEKAWTKGQDMQAEVHQFFQELT